MKSLSGTIITLLLLGIGCSNKIPQRENIFMQLKAHIPTSQICIQNQIKERIAVGERLNTHEKDTMATISFDKNGNILSMRIHLRGTIEYQYKDSLLVEQREYTYRDELQRKVRYSYIKGARIDSIYDSSHLYFWTKSYQDQHNRDTAVYRFAEHTNWELKGKETTIYDELGFKDYTLKQSDGYTILKKRINNDSLKHIIQYYYGFGSLILNDLKEKETIEYNNSRHQTQYQIEELNIEEHNIRYRTEYYENGLAKKDAYYNKENKPTYELNYIYTYF